MKKNEENEKPKKPIDEESGTGKKRVSFAYDVKFKTSHADLLPSMKEALWSISLLIH